MFWGNITSALVYVLVFNNFNCAGANFPRLLVLLLVLLHAQVGARLSMSAASALFGGGMMIGGLGVHLHK